MSDCSIKQSYCTLLTRFKDHTVGTETLLQLKNSLKDEIGSPRQLSLASSLSDVIYLLERQLILHEHKISPLKKILERVKIIGAEEQIIQHHKLLIDYNYTANRIGYKMDQLEKESVVSTDHYIPPCVTDEISTRIGHSWVEFAIELGITEGEIDDIDSEFPTHVEKCYEVMNKFVSLNGNNCKRVQLLNALSNIRRKKLQREVEQKLMATCINCRHSTNH